MNNIHFRLYDDIKLIEKKWISFQKHASYYYFQNIDWAKRWYLTIGKNEKTLIVEIFINKSNTIAILPFSISSFNGIKIMSWIGGDYGCGIYSNEFNKIVKPNGLNIDSDINPEWAKANLQNTVIQGGLNPNLVAYTIIAIEPSRTGIFKF